MNILLSASLAGETFPIDIRIMLIAAVFLSLAAFIMSSFAAFLFYKFYRDTIKPVPLLVQEKYGLSFKINLTNNGNSAFYIFRIFFLKGSKITNSLLDFLPAIHEEEVYTMFTKMIEGRKVIPDQQLKLFEIDFSYLKAYISDDKVKTIIDHLDGIIIEIHCQDIGKRYKSVNRMAIDIIEWEQSNF